MSIRLTYFCKRAIFIIGAMNKPLTNPLFLSDTELQKAIEMLFFAYQKFTGVADNILTAHNFGRAHHRSLYFIGRHPGITLSELIEILAVSKQSLNRVLRILLETGFIEQRDITADKRKKSLFLTAKGEELNKVLIEAQKRFIASAYRAEGAESASAFADVLKRMAEA